jgi:cellulose synthase/poly-beta-1,6-N-acetylglucosamine synthase-like glycosyltransferase
VLPENTVADDSALAVAVRKKGFKTIYDPACIFYEYAPPTPSSRYIQKVRRAQGLIQLFLREWKILFNTTYGLFGMIIFPAEFFMHVVSPFLVFIFLAALLWSIPSNAYLVYGIVTILVGFILFSLGNRSLFHIAATFFQSQCILLISIFYLLLGRTQNVWPQVEEIRNLWQREQKR